MLYEVITFPFTAAAVDPGNFGEAWWQQPLFQNSLRYGMGTLLCLLLVLLGIRPLVNYLVQQHRHERAERGERDERDGEALAALPEGLVADGESPVQAPAVSYNFV